MKTKELLTKRLLPVTAVAAAAGLAVAGVFYASTPSSSPAPVTPAATATATATASVAPITLGRVGWRADAIWLTRHTIHAQLIVHTERAGFVTIDIDRGRLQSAPTSTVTLVRADHVTVTATITSSTHFLGLPESSMAEGDRVVVLQHDGEALYVLSRPPRASTS